MSRYGNVWFRVTVLAVATGLPTVAAACTGSNPAPSASSPPATLAPSATQPVTTSTPPPGPKWRELRQAPIEGRIGAGVVWTGKEMIVWGGVTRAKRIEAADDGGAYDPATDSWRTLAPAPSGVLGDVGSAAAWTGKVAVFWAGNSPDGPVAGGIYDPRRDSWARLPDGPLGPREGYASVWTGKELLIMAGTSGDAYASPVGSGIDPRTRSWRLLSGLNRYPGMLVNGAVWEGHEVFLAGTLSLCPELGSSCQQRRPIFLSYDPAADRATEIDLRTSPHPGPRASRLTPIGWTGSNVLFVTRDASKVGVVTYDPSRGTWATGQPAPCSIGTEGGAQMAWLDDRLAVSCDQDRLLIYDPNADAWKTIEAGRSVFNSADVSAVAWTGNELIVWSGVLNRVGNPTPDTGSIIALGS
jgi:hypothetical protein